MTAKHFGPKTSYAQQIFKEKYAFINESFEDVINRIAGTLQDPDELFPNHYKTIREILLTQRFLPAGRIQASIGSSKNITPNRDNIKSKVSAKSSSG